MQSQGTEWGRGGRWAIPITLPCEWLISNPARPHSLSTWIPFQTNKQRDIEKGSLSETLAVSWTLVMVLFQALPHTKSWQSKKVGVWADALS